MRAAQLTNLETISSWSGGKDSSLACYKAIQQGYSVKYLLNFISRESKRGCFHGIEAGLLKLQAEAVGIPLVQKEVSPDMKMYEQEFKQAVLELKARGLNTMVFGDIYLLDHANWVERVCNELGITSLEPLWNKSPEGLIEEFLALGFQALVVSCQAKTLGQEFIGRYLDKEMVKEFKKRGVCPCGENGEFHTFVTDGPLFKKKIEITKSRPVLKEGFWPHWFLDIQEYRAIEREIQ